MRDYRVYGPLAVVVCGEWRVKCEKYRSIAEIWHAIMPDVFSL
jgi:hypothetical protein